MFAWKKNNTETTNEDCDEPKVFSIEKSIIESPPQGNKIYFYADITKESILNLNKQLDDLSKQMKIAQFNFNLPHPPAIEIHICSDGGDIFASLASVDKILNSDVSIHTYIEGVGASAATLLSVCGHKRFITKNSCALLHQLSGNFWGNFAQLVDEHANFSLIMKILKNIYLQRTKFSSKELDELLKHDLYLDSNTCLKKGLVDKII